MLDYKTFKIEFYSAIRERYSNAIIEKEELAILQGNVEALVQLKYAYDEYRALKSFKIIVEKYLEIINSEFESVRFKVDYNTVYPLIKSKEFGKDEFAEFVRESLFLDLDILYAVDCGETIRFIMKNDDYDFEKLKENALKNLNVLFSGLRKLDNDLEIYSVPFFTDYSASFILIDKMKKLAERKVGKNYFFTISSSSSIFVAKYNNMYIEILKELAKADPDPHKVSDHIYLYRNGNVDFAEKNNLLKIIK